MSLTYEKKAALRKLAVERQEGLIDHGAMAVIGPINKGDGRER